MKTDTLTINRGNRSQTYVLIILPSPSMERLMSPRLCPVRIELTTPAPVGKHVRSCIVYTWDHKSSAAFWAGMKV